MLRSLLPLYANALLALFVGVALNANTALADGINDFPKCTADCANQAAATDGCQPTDVNCVCADSDFLGKIQSCAVAAGCNFGDISVTSFKFQSMCANAPSSASAGTSNTASSGQSASVSASNSASVPPSKTTSNLASNPTSTGSLHVSPTNTIGGGGSSSSSGASSPSVTPSGLIPVNTLLSPPSSTGAPQVIQFVSSTFTADPTDSTTPPDDSGVIPGSGAGFSIGSSRWSVTALLMITGIIVGVMA